MAPVVAILAALALAHSALSAPTLPSEGSLDQLIFSDQVAADGKDTIVAAWQTTVNRIARPAKQSINDILEQSGLRNAYPVKHAAAAHPPPGHPPIEVDFSDYTVWEILEAVLKSHHDHPPEHPIPPPHGPPPPIEKPEDLPLHKLAWWVNKTDEIKELLDGEETVSLLAPWDAAVPPFRKPHHEHGEKGMWVNYEGRGEERARHGKHGRHGKGDELAHAYGGQADSFIHDLEAMKTLDALKDDDDDDEEKKKKILRIVTFILKYHISPDLLSFPVVLNSSTITTSLRGARLRVDTHPTWGWKPFPGPRFETTFNFYSHRRGPAILAKNGIIHLVDKPILPPLPAFDQVAIFPGWFSTVTSGLLLSGLDEKIRHEHSEAIGTLRAHAAGVKTAIPAELAHLYDEETADEVPTGVMEVLEELVEEHKGKHSKTGGVTVFVPSNRAFRKFGIKINAILFSPFPRSRQLLKTVLAYHIVPNVTVFSDFVRNESASFTYNREINVELPHPPPPPGAKCHGRPGFGPRRTSPFRAGLKSLFSRVISFARLRDPFAEYAALGLPHWPHPPPPPKGNITHLFLPTLANVSLPIDVFAAEVGPPPHLPGPHGIKRWVVVKPYAIAKDPWHRKEGESPIEKDPKVGVKIGDAPAWEGALHVVGDVLLPPKEALEHGRQEMGARREEEWEEALRWLVEELEEVKEDREWY